MNELKDGDYLLIEGAGWFTVKGFSVRVHMTDEGVIVDIYGQGKEMDSPIASTYAFEHELIEDEEE
jgi:hypothetical protein